MAHMTVEKKIFPIFLITQVGLGTYINIQGNMYNEIYYLELGEELYVRIEPNNCFYKFVVFAGKERNFDGYLKKGSSKKFTKGITSK